MPSIYCFNCGKKNDYSALRPTKCCGCGQSPYVQASLLERKADKKAEKLKARARFRDEEYDDGEDEYDDFEVPDIKELKVKINVPQNHGKQTIGDIVEAEKAAAKASGKKKVAPSKRKKHQKKVGRGDDGSSFDDIIARGSGQAKRSTVGGD